MGARGDGCSFPWYSRTPFNSAVTRAKALASARALVRNVERPPLSSCGDHRWLRSTPFTATTSKLLAKSSLCLSASLKPSSEGARSFLRCTATHRIFLHGRTGYLARIAEDAPISFLRPHNATASCTFINIPARPILRPEPDLGLISRNARCWR